MMSFANYKRFILVSMLVCFSLMPLFPQNKMTLDNAIDDFATKFVSRFPDKNQLAVIAFETDKQDLMTHFIDTMVEVLMKKGIAVYERKRIQHLLTEANFSLTGYVSDETMLRIGQIIGVDTVIYGSIKGGNGRNEYRMTITAANVETSQILSQISFDLQMDPRLSGLLGITEDRLWTVGISGGSSFSAPWAIITVHGTIAPFQYSFLEAGMDIGLVSGYSDVKYYSLYPFIHYAAFMPFEKGGGWYGGIGGGYMYGKYSLGQWQNTVNVFAVDLITGFNILNLIDISYTFRTNFTNVNHKVSAGLVYRFKRR
jgi:hypothetical protein